MNEVNLTLLYRELRYDLFINKERGMKTYGKSKC